MGDEMFRRPRVSIGGIGMEPHSLPDRGKPHDKSSHGRRSSRCLETGSINGMSSENQLNQSCTEALLASVFDQVSPVTPGHQRSRRGHAGSKSTTGPIQSTPAASIANEYLAYSSDEEFEAFMQKPRTDYTYSRSVSYNTVSPERVGPPSMSRLSLHCPAAGDSPVLMVTGHGRLPVTAARDPADFYEKTSTQVYSYRREITSYEASPLNAGRGGGDTPLRASTARASRREMNEGVLCSLPPEELEIACGHTGVGGHIISPGLDQDSADEEAVSARHLSYNTANGGKNVRLMSSPHAVLPSAQVSNAVSTALLWPLLQLYTVLLTTCHYVSTPFRRNTPGVVESPGNHSDKEHAFVHTSWKQGRESQEPPSDVSSRSRHRYKLRSTPQRVALQETHHHNLTTTAQDGPNPTAEHAVNASPADGTWATSQSVGRTVKTSASYANPLWWTGTALSFLSGCVQSAGRRLNPTSWLRGANHRVSGARLTPGWLRSAAVLLAGSQGAASAEDLTSARVLAPMEQPSTSHQASAYSAYGSAPAQKMAHSPHMAEGRAGCSMSVTQDKPVGRGWCCYLLPLLLLLLLLLPLVGLLLTDDSSDDTLPLTSRIISHTSHYITTIGATASSALAALKSSTTTSVAATGRVLYSGGVSVAAAICCCAELLTSLATSAATATGSVMSSLTCLVISASLTALETLSALGGILFNTLMQWLTSLGVTSADKLSTVGSAFSDVTESLFASGDDVIVSLGGGASAAVGAVASAVMSALTTLGALVMVFLQLLWTSLAGLGGTVASFTSVITSVPAVVPLAPQVPEVPVVRQVPLDEVYGQLTELRAQVDLLHDQYKSCRAAMDPASLRLALNLPTTSGLVTSSQLSETRRRLTSQLGRLDARVTSQAAVTSPVVPQLQARVHRLAAEGRESEERRRRVEQEVEELNGEVRQLHKTLLSVQENLRQTRSCCNRTQTDWGSVLTVRLQNVSELLDRRVRMYTNALKQDLSSVAAAGITSTSGGISRQEAVSIARHQVALYDADKTGKFDFALESAGGSIMSTQCTEPYTRHAAQYSLLGVPLWYSSNNPRSIIQPSTRPGECFAFRGEGVFVISLSRPVRPSEVVLEHIARQLTPGGTIDSAPRHFSVLGVGESMDTSFPLGDFEYDAQAGPPLQQFSVSSTDGRVVTAVQLRVHSNWGEPEYTCLYRFRVHGDVEPSHSP